MPKMTAFFMLCLSSQIVVSACCVTDFLFSGSRSPSGSRPGSSASTPASGNTPSARPTAIQAATPGSVRPSTSGGLATPAPAQPPSTGSTPRPLASSSITWPVLTVTPIPIGIPIPVPLLIPVGIPLPVPDLRPTAAPVGSGSTQPAPAPGGAAPVAQTRLFEIEAVKVIRQADLRYRIEVTGQGFGVLEAYAFLEIKLGPYAIPLIENGIYRGNPPEVQELAIGDSELRFVWQPAQGGPTASDRFQWLFQPQGSTQRFETAEINVTLTSE